MKRSRKILVILAVAALIIFLMVAGAIRRSGNSTLFGGRRLAAVDTVKIEKGNISSYITASGIVREVDRADVYFDSPLKVKRLLVKKNQSVTKGQKLVELDMDSLYSELDKLKANKKIQELQANSGMSSAEVERARINLKNAESAYNESLEAYNDAKELFNAGMITQKELDMAKRALNETESALTLTRLALKTAEESKNISTQTAEQNLKTINAAIKELEKKINNIEAAMGSPIDGVVSSVNISAGALTSTVQPAFSIINTDRLQITAYIREFDIKNVAPGQFVDITGEAIDENIKVTGKVSSVSPAATLTQTANGQEIVIEAIIDINNPQGLKPGISVSCDISTSSRENVLIAPLQSFLEDKDGNKLVFVVDTSNNTLIETKVKTGISSDMETEITEGLKEGDVIVLDPQPAYRTGEKVRIK